MFASMERLCNYLTKIQKSKFQHLLLITKYMMEYSHVRIMGIGQTSDQPNSANVALD